VPITQRHTYPVRVPLSVTDSTGYQQAVADLQGQYRSIPPGRPVRLAKRTSNLFRPRTPAPGHGLDVSAFSGVLSIDVDARTADVLGMTTYEDLVDATLAVGLMPLVVPQLRTITLGGAVTGLGIESSSFRHGLPHESVMELDILTGAGEVVTVTNAPDDPHRDLFLAFPNSYGSLGYALRLRIELMPVRPFVVLRHVPVGSAAEAADLMERIADSGEHDGTPVDFLDGTVFGPDEHHLTLGTWADELPAGVGAPSDYTGMEIYYRSIRSRRTDVLTVHDYIWRWDTDWFWCSRAFGAQNPALRRIWPASKLRSDVYWKLVALDRRAGLSRHITRLRGQPPREEVIQDIEVRVDRLAEFLDFFHREVGISPIWLCPLRSRDGRTRWPLYEMDPAALYVNVGFWSTVAVPPGAKPAEGRINRSIEAEVTRLGGRKSLYSTAYYPRDEFADLYGGASYADVRGRYDPEGRLTDLYRKVVLRG
jgi:FAD/FMN-containing dehydrogenase